MENNSSIYNHLAGQETEYAIRFSPARGFKRPANNMLFHALCEGISAFVKTTPGYRSFYHEHIFTENGGSFNYEYQPKAPEAGLLEGATPECSSPSELLMYQRAQEALLIRAIPRAEKILKFNGIRGKLGLIKNCRDSQGNIYGAQENYETDIGGPVSYFFYLLGLILFIPVWLTTVVLIWSLIIIISLVLFSIVITLVVISFLFRIPADYIRKRIKFTRSKKQKRIRPLFIEHIFNIFNALIGYSPKIPGSESESNDRSFEYLDRSFVKIQYYIFFPLQFAVLLPYVLWLRIFAFRRQRRALLAFFVSRPIISGAGTLLHDGTFALSEKGTAINKTARLTISPNERSIFDYGNLIKGFHFAVINILLLRFSSSRHILRKKQRMQLGFSDSNRAQYAEYLKIGTTFILIEMLDSGFLKSPPHLKSPIDALHAIVSDPTLKKTVKVAGQQEMSALDIQRFYLKQAKNYLNTKKGLPLEYYKILQLWEETLNTLEDDPGKLVGRIDWVSKRYLIETSGAGKPYEVKKKIDIAYHELGSGYFDLLEEKGIAPKIVEDSDIEQAITEPSSPGHVRLRSDMIKNATYIGKQVRISWHSARIGNFWNRKIIPINKYKK